MGSVPHSVQDPLTSTAVNVEGTLNVLLAAIGLRNHEAPFLDVGDHTPVEPGMVFTIEPGLYASDAGGFRHSDTVVVTEDGIDVLTSYPSDIESLTIPA